MLFAGARQKKTTGVNCIIAAGPGNGMGSFDEPDGIGNAAVGSAADKRGRSVDDQKLPARLPPDEMSTSGCCVDQAGSGPPRSGRGGQTPFLRWALDRTSGRGDRSFPLERQSAMEVYGSMVLPHDRGGYCAPQPRGPSCRGSSPCGRALDSDPVNGRSLSEAPILRVTGSVDRLWRPQLLV